jgi:hypothetical protein
MSETVICGEGQDTYEVRITAYPDLRQKLRRAFNTRGKTGEDKVSAIVASGGVEHIYRVKDGRYNDGPNGEPGEQFFYNKRITTMNDMDWHYKDGHPTSLVTFHDKGRVESVYRYENDRVHDLASGEAAIEEYDRNGGLIKVGRADGTLYNLRPQDEMESIEKYYGAAIADHFRSTEVKYLNAQEIAAYAVKFNKALPGTPQETPAAATKTKASPVRKIVSGFKRRL